MASATRPAPRKQAMMGLSVLTPATRTTASAVLMHSVMACGVSSTMALWTAGSSRTSSRAYS